MIRVTRRVIRFLGWLLTPMIAWAAAFFGGRLGAGLAAYVESPKRGFLLTIVAAGVSAAAATWLWAWAIRRSARLQAWSRRRWRQRRVQRAAEKKDKPIANHPHKMSAQHGGHNVQRAANE